LNIEPTEEIDAARVRVPYLKNRFAKMEDFFSDDRVTQTKHVDKITVTISPASYAMKFISTEPYGGGGIQYFLQPDATRAGYSESAPRSVEYKTLKDARQDRVQELLVRNNSWMKDLSRDEVDARKLAFKQDLDVGAKNSDSDGEDVEMDDS
jgi:paired amphipathic helix protein Sin3a